MDNEKLKREELIKIVQENKNVEENGYSKIVDLLKEKINQYHYSDDERFYTFGRRDSVIKEFNQNILEKNQKDAYSDILDIIYCNDFIPLNYRSEIESKGLDFGQVQNDMENYKKEGYICLKEKEVILNMINKFNDLIKNDKSSDSEKNRIVTPPTNMNYDELRKLRREKIDLCISKLNGDIDEVEKRNQEFLLQTLKKILWNIKMIDSKLLRKFPDKMNNVEKETLLVEMSILDGTEPLIKNFEDIEIVVEKINIGLSNEKNKEIIESKNLPYSSNLIMIPTPKNCELSSSEWICKLLTKDYLLATLSTTTYDAEYFKFIYNNLNSMYKLENVLKDDEKEIVDKLLNNDASVDRNKLSWLYEECFVFAWIIGLCEFPQQETENNTKILDDLLFIKTDEINKRNLPSKLYDLLYDKENKKFDYSKLKSKKLSEIYEKADLIKRYLWGLEELRINKKDNNSGLNEKVVYYQLEAFREIFYRDLTNPGKYIHEKINIKIDEEKIEEMKEEIKDKHIGWDDIDKVCDTLYPNQEPLHYAPVIKYNLGGKDPLDGISIYDAGDYYHFVTYGFSEIYEKENQNKDISGFGFELTYKLKKYDEINEAELKNFCGILQQLARYVFETKKVYKTYEYLYTGQTDGIDIEHKSSIVAFVTIEDKLLKTIDTINGKLQFIELVGITNAELKQILDKTKPRQEIIDEIISKFGDITDYRR